MDDKTLCRVRDIANAPLPPEPAADPRHFGQCLRILLAVLPKRSQDELSGELFIAAYQRKLGHFSNAGMSYLADKAMDKCQWFPTIAECLEIMEGYWRQDDLWQRRNFARELDQRERSARNREELAARRIEHAKMTQADVDVLPEGLKRIGLRAGYLIEGEDGRVLLTPEPEHDPNAEIIF